jgi:D-xylose 1-dehydrogenase (NADP+, D-xylono-1,5-lactone-forming)
MSEPLRWGILGTGNIASQFCAGLRETSRNRLAAVASRRPESADHFARSFQVPTAYAGYEQLLVDPAVDVVYISLPNSMHHEWTIKALRAGKHVLCEKPFAVNTQQAEEMFDTADAAGRLVMEAFMYRSHPLTRAVEQQVRAGAIGQLQLIRTSFCYRTSRIDDNIRFDPTLAGGALMDVGCYCINFSRHFAGQEPDQVHASARLHPRGVDDLTAGTLHFPNGILASFTCGMTVQADNTACLCGTEGYIEIPIPWKPPQHQAAYTIAHSTPPRMDLIPGKPAPPPRQMHHVDAPTTLFGLEANDFAAAIQDNAPLPIPRQDTLGNMQVLDEIHHQIRTSQIAVSDDDSSTT